MADPQFINRQAEIDMVAEDITRAYSSASCITHFYGIPGIGKTRLLEHIATYFCPQDPRAFCILAHCDQIASTPDCTDRLMAMVSTQLAHQRDVQVTITNWAALVDIINQQKGNLRLYRE